MRPAMKRKVRRCGFGATIADVSETEILIAEITLIPDAELSAVSHRVCGRSTDHVLHHTQVLEQHDETGQDLPSDQAGGMSARLPRAAVEADTVVGRNVAISDQIAYPTDGSAVAFVLPVPEGPWAGRRRR